MTLRFHKTLYDGEAVDQAVKELSDWAEFTLTEEDDHWVVAIAPGEDVDGAMIRGELSNYALGLTIERRGAQ